MRHNPKVTCADIIKHVRSHQSPDMISISRDVATEWVSIITMLAKDNGNQIEAWNANPNAVAKALIALKKGQ
jgi:hypothetical protein